MQQDRVLRDIAYHTSPTLQVDLCKWPPVNQDLSFYGLEQSNYQVDKGRFASARRADEGGECSTGNLKRDICQNHVVTITKINPVKDDLVFEGCCDFSTCRFLLQLSFIDLLLELPVSAFADYHHLVSTLDFSGLRQHA